MASCLARVWQSFSITAVDWKNQTLLSWKKKLMHLQFFYSAQCKGKTLFAPNYHWNFSRRRWCLLGSDNAIMGSSTDLSHFHHSWLNIGLGIYETCPPLERYPGRWREKRGKEIGQRKGKDRKTIAEQICKTYQMFGASLLRFNVNHTFSIKTK